MPIYDFKCNQCGKVSEILIRTDSQIINCPDCGSNDIAKLISSSYLVKMGNSTSGGTCCGREERCDSPPCSTGGGCHRH